MNLIPVIREALGLEMNEEFNLKNEQNVVLPDKFRFTDRTFQVEGNERWIETHCMMFKLLLKGECEVVKQPFKPKENEIYYFVHLENGDVYKTIYRPANKSDRVNVNSGNCYKTVEEAEKHVDEWMGKLYGKEWRKLYESDTND